jgi:VWFA-related protein
MKRLDPSYTVFHRIALIPILWSGLVLMPGQAGRGNQGAPPYRDQQGGETEQGFKLRVAVEEVRLDAVVINKKGLQIADLTAGEFEVYQDGQRQQITSCIYVADSQADSGKGPAISKNPNPTLPVGPSLLAPGQVRRAIAFVVDDLAMGFINVYAARLALEKFVKNEMQPGDLVAILRTSRGIGALQIFSSDKRQLLAMIKTVRWGFGYGNLSQITAISYCIRALQDMPGRKHLMLMTSQTIVNGSMFGERAGSTQRGPDLNAFNLLADQAMRAGVVIHTLDMAGLRGPHLTFPWSSVDVSTLGNTEAELPLSKKTGGVFIKDSNYGINKRLLEEIRGYYLLSYIPPEKTFAKEKRGVYHRVKIRTSRPGAEVHTRDGFFGLTEPYNDLATLRNSLREAIFSPFRSNDLKVNLAFGYLDDSPKGYLLRSWLHVDARNLKPVEGSDGTYSLNLDTACVTSDFNDYIQDAGNLQYQFRIKKENIAWVKEHGLRFSLSLPVKKPGAYYVRVAVRDPASEKLGSAYQFIEIPDLKKHRLSLSSVFVINRDEDASWLESGRTPESQGWPQPDLRRDPRNNPALRSYLAGESFEYVTFVYNAKIRDGQTPDLDCQSILYRNGSEFFKSNAEPIDLSDVKDFRKITVRKRLLLGDAMQPGDYVLLLQVRDRKAKAKDSLTVQALDFEILATQQNEEDPAPSAVR